MTSIPQRLIGSASALLVVALLAVGGGASALASGSGTAHSARHHTRHHRSSHHKSRHRGNCIPQHGGGDNDTDNHGGPSDGDGCK